jgi:tetratricopeptide (TPR) repeat protein
MASMLSTFELILSNTGNPRQYLASVSDDNDGYAAQHEFEWRTDSTSLNLTLADLAHAATSNQPPTKDLHIQFGQQLFQTIFAGDVGAHWQKRRKQSRRTPLRLVLRINPETAQPLLNLPWEYLHDEDHFLALDWHTPLSRLPWGLDYESFNPLTEPLRMLVMISAPLDLNQNQVLNTEREVDLILAATSQARRAGQLHIEFTPAGSLGALVNALQELDPHMLHFVGHGTFSKSKDRGYLLLEDPHGRKQEVPNEEFAQKLEQHARSLRMVFLSSCQTAVAPRTEGFADLGSRLLKTGFPAVVAMQYSVLNKSAMEFGSAFYHAAVKGKPLDEAVTTGRCGLLESSPNKVDFATPVLFLSDPACLKVDASAFEPSGKDVPRDLSGVTQAQHFVGRSAELRELQTRLDPQHGNWRAAVLYGLGGMGKTVLASRLIDRTASRLDGIIALRMTPTTTAQNVLDRIGAFLLINNAHFALPTINQFNHIKNDALPLQTKAGKLVEILNHLKLLIVFDNCEDVLPKGQAVSREAQQENEQSAAGIDPDLPKLFSILVGNVPGPSRILFTSRMDFHPLEKGRLTGSIGHLNLDEMGFRDTVYLMETLPPLDQLPVVVLSSSLNTQGAHQESDQPELKAISMRDIYDRMGGHPYTLYLFATHVQKRSVREVLSDLNGVEKELLDFTLLEKAVDQLEQRAGELLVRAAIFDEIVPIEGLSYLMGDKKDVMPEVSEEAAALQSWGLLAQPLGTRVFSMHSLVRRWGRQKMSAEQRLELLRRAANYWAIEGRDSASLMPLLNAHHYLMLAGDYEQADDIVQSSVPYLLRWGQLELLIRLLEDSVRTLTGKRQAMARGNLAIVFQDLGDYRTARRIHEEVLEEFRALDEKPQIASSLHNLGMLHQLQGEYPEAREMYEQSLVITKELGDRAGVASSLHQLGNLHFLQGEYPEAREMYEQSLEINKELGNREGVASTLHQLGTLHQRQGEYPEAREMYEHSLVIK